MQYGLVVVSASRSRPCPRPARGWLREADTTTCLLVSPVFAHLVVWVRSIVGVSVRAIGTVTRMGRDPIFRGSGPRPFRSSVSRGSRYRGLGPGRGRFRPRGARDFSNRRIVEGPELCVAIIQTRTFGHQWSAAKSLPPTKSA